MYYEYNVWEQKENQAGKWVKYAVLAGRLHGNPQTLSVKQAGQSFVMKGAQGTPFSLIVKKYNKNTQENKDEFLYLAAWGATIDYFQRNVKNGQALVVVARVDEYQGDNGNVMTTYNIVKVEKAPHSTGEAKASQGQQTSGQQQAPQYGQQQAPQYGQPPQYGQQQAPQYGQPPQYGQQQAPQYGQPPTGGQQQAPQYGQPPTGGQQQAPQYGQPPTGGQQQAPQYGQPPTGGQQQAPQYGQPPTGGQQQPPQYGQPPTGGQQQPPQYGQQQQQAPGGVATMEQYPFAGAGQTIDISDDDLPF